MPHVPLIPPGHEASRISGAKGIGWLIEASSRRQDPAARIARAAPDRPWQTHWSHGRRATDHQVLTGHDGRVAGDDGGGEGAAGRHPGHRQRPPGRHGAAVAAGRQHPARAPAETIDTGGPRRRSRQYHRHCGRVRHRRPPASAPATHAQRCCCSISWNEDLSARRSDNGLSCADQATRMPGEGLRTV